MNKIQTIEKTIADLKRIDTSIQANQDAAFAESVHPYVIDDAAILLQEYADTLK